MASDSNLESSSIFEIESEVSLSSRPTSKRPSKYDKFCRRAPKGEEYDEKGKLLYYCNQCEFKTNATTNFQLHYKKHGVTIEFDGRELRTKKAQKEVQEVADRVQTDKILQETLDKKVVETTLLELLIVKNIPFRIVESQEFQTFCYSLNPQAVKILPSHHSTIVTKVITLRRNYRTMLI
jgi:hypothetical protein